MGGSVGKVKVWSLSLEPHTCVKAHTRTPALEPQRQEDPRSPFGHPNRQAPGSEGDSISKTMVEMTEEDTCH